MYKFLWDKKKRFEIQVSIKKFHMLKLNWVNYTSICIALVASKSLQLIIFFLRRQLIIFTKIKKYAINIRVTELNIGHKIEYVFYNYFLSTFSTRVERKGYTFFPCEHLYCPLVHCPVQSLGFIPGHLAIWPSSTVLAFFFFFFYIRKR